MISSEEIQHCCNWNKCYRSACDIARYTWYYCANLFIDCLIGGVPIKLHIFGLLPNYYPSLKSIPADCLILTPPPPTDARGVN